jgi:hypothetical protein
MRPARTHLSVAAALFIALTLAAVAPIRSYDSFWHLATGRWIVEHRALPLHDPFTIASDRVPWINGQWLFQVVLYGIEQLVGLSGVSWVRAAFVAAIFVFAWAAARSVDGRGATLIATSVGFAGAAAFLDVRPATVAAMCVVIAIALLDRIRDASGGRRIFLSLAYVLLTIVWINVHPSALLAPIFALLAWSGPLASLGSAAALLVNPFGLEGVTAPLRLMSFVQSGAFVNAEWLPSSPLRFPLLYVAIAAAIALFAFTNDRRAHLWRVLIFCALAWLAVRHVRNQPLLFCALPLLVAPLGRREIPRFAQIAAAALAILGVALATSHDRGVDPERFPAVAVARLQASGLRGNIYNPDQFGGFLIWSFYPERRVLPDGRNELYHSFIPEYAAARNDSRKWNALLRHYDIALAVDEYRAPLPVVDARTGRSTSMPASLAYFPRQQWALVAYDEAGMVFARRAAFTQAQLSQWEIAGVVPDAR